VYIVLGLGNPGKEYTDTRHNVGFKVIEKIASDNRVKLKLSGLTLSAEIKESSLRKATFVIAKSAVFMNLSGIPAKELLDKYNEPSNSLIVIHDDIDLDIGNLRLKRSSGPGGHNGILSIINNVGNKDFCQIKIGIGRPGNKNDVVDYVLDKFNKYEEEKITEIVELCEIALLDMLDNGFEYAANKYNRRN
jgi:peptidyl-tRNA hydrolase, PTH1 family